MTLATNHHTKQKQRSLNGRYPLPSVYQPKPLAPPERAIHGKVALAVLATAVLGTLLWILWEPLTQLTAALSDRQAVSAALKSYGLLGPLALAVMQFLQVLVAVIPGHVFLIAAGYVYGLVPGLLLNWGFTVAASQVAFLLARWAGRPFVHRLAPDHLIAKWETIAEAKGTTFFTISFILPVFPTDMMNFVAGLSGMSGRNFFIANLIGRLPGVLMLTLIGSHGLELTNAAWAGLAVVAALLYVIGRVVMAKIEAAYNSNLPVTAPTD